MSSKPLHHYSVHELRIGLDQKQFSSTELTQHFLDRIQTHNPDINAYIHFDADAALMQAKAADARIAKGDHGLLTGIPLAQKDIFCTAGQKTTCASKMLENFVPAYDATVVSKLNAAGSIMLGKANMDEFAMGSSNENSYFGPVKNPWGDNHVPGGSSGGSAAAVAADLAPMATGTDTGGSVRQPAAFCGITGIKPTYGSVSRYGMIAFASSFDQGGAFGRSAADCAALLEHMTGHDPKDSTSNPRAKPNYVQHLGTALAGKTIGLPKEYFAAKCAPAILDATEQFKSELSKLGVNFVEVSLPHFALGMAAYYILAPAECSSNLARFDGVRYGYRCDNPTDLNDLYCRSRNEGFGDEVKRRILIGTYVLSSGFIDAYYYQAQRVRRLIRNDFSAALKQADVLLTPTTPTTAYPIGSTLQPEYAYSQDIFTIGVNLAGLPGLSLPIGFDNKQLPIGAQLIGNDFAEAELLNIAHQYQTQTDWHLQRPEGL